MKRTQCFMVLAIFPVLFGQACLVKAQEQPADPNTSKTPHYTFSDTLEEQLEELETNPLLKRFRISREAKADDPHRPIYHYVNPEGRLNDPNGLCFWQGRWHLFYQAYPLDDPRQHWGHAVSDDLIHWQDLPLAIYPGPERACFSGATFVDADATFQERAALYGRTIINGDVGIKKVEEDRVIAMYHGTTVGNMVAVSSDPLLLNWEKLTGEAVIPMDGIDELKPPYRIFDACIWKKGDLYYSLSAGTLPEGPDDKRIRGNFLWKSTDLADWEYMHPFVEDDHYSRVGDDGACPYFWPIGDKYILAHYSHTRGGKYLLGDYDLDRDKFVVTDGGDFNFGASSPSGVHAPSAYPDGDDGVIIIFNMNPGEPTPRGDLIWNQIMTLPRRLTLLPDDPLNNLRVEPAGDVESLRRDLVHVEPRTLPANQEIVLDGVQGNAIEIEAEINAKNANVIELNVLRSPDKEEYTRILFYKGRGNRHREWGRLDPRAKMVDSVLTIDASMASTLPGIRTRPPESGSLYIPPDETLKLRVFVDKSVIEIFVNEKLCVSMRVYPGREDSTGVSIRAQGNDAELLSLDAWQMNNIYE
jgi:beta-fructofuranosidase